VGNDVRPSDELLKKILKEEVSEEEVHAGVSPTSTTYAKVKGSSIPSGYDGIVMGVAVSRDETITLYLKRAEKDVYSDGLNTAALSSVAQTAGVDNEVPLLVLFKEKQAWELGFKASAGTPKVNWRIRIRLYKKG